MNTLTMKLILIISFAIVFKLAVACGNDSTDNLLPPEPAAAVSSSESGPISVVTTSNIVADWVKRVGGERVDVFSLLPPNSDPHTFQPGARDTARVADADLVLTVGLGLESGWLNELVENAALDNDSIAELGNAVDPIAFMEMGDQRGEEEADDEGHDHGPLSIPTSGSIRVE